MRCASLGLLSATIAAVHGQVLPLPLTPTTAWNSSFKFSADQIERASLTPALATTLEAVLNFDRTQLANGGSAYDSFYTLPIGTKKPNKPGQVLKVQNFTDPTPYNLPSRLALSRFIYSSTNLNGTLVPASAYVLWPWAAKSFDPSKFQTKGKLPVVLWTHGTYGTNADGAPSAHRSLFYGEYMPTVLAQAGYVVVAPDYAGTGIDKSWDGSFVPNQYLTREAAAADALNSLRAAREIYSKAFTNEYVVVGHSQGGNTAWGTMELLAQTPQKYEDLERGHQGTVLFAPGRNAPFFAPSILLTWIASYLDKIFTDFTLKDWLSPLGISRAQLLAEVKGGQFFTQILFGNATEVLNPRWNETWYAGAFAALSNPGSRPWKGPTVLFHGTQDIAVDYNGSLANYRSTCKKYPGDFEFVTLPQTTHFGVMDATRQKWLDWIQARFENRPLEKYGCVEGAINSFLPVENYQIVRKYFSQWSNELQWAYQVPQGL